ncbi:hypothetical protein U9M48_009422, partial [Paspalum notatum var. saurae]
FCPRLASALVGTEPARTKSSSFPHTRNPRSRRSPASRRAAAARARAHASAPGPAIACPCPRESQARPRQTLPPLTPRFSARPTATPDPARLRPDCDIRPRASGPRRPLVEAVRLVVNSGSFHKPSRGSSRGRHGDTGAKPRHFLAPCRVKKNPHQHKCTSARRSKNVKNATKFWICEQVKDWLMEDSRVGPKELQWRIKDKYKVQLPYKRVFDGKCLAQTELFGSWDSSFDNLFRFKKEVERSCPGSSVVIDHHTIEGKIRFNRLFFAMKPFIDGFLNGCRPYLAIDSTFLTGRFREQLACAVAVDGHNWMYPVAVGVIDSETNENWSWFMHRLRDAIGTPKGLAICTDAGAAVMEGVKEVFPTAEHRECMLHLVMNFKKRYSGKIFDDHLWAAAYSWSPYFFEKH